MLHGLQPAFKMPTFAHMSLMKGSDFAPACVVECPLHACHHAAAHAAFCPFNSGHAAVTLGPCCGLIEHTMRFDTAV